MMPIVVGLLLVVSGSVTVGAVLFSRRPASLDAHWRDVRRTFRDTAINYRPRGGSSCR